jgi:hypothetical protein
MTGFLAVAWFELPTLATVRAPFPLPTGSTRSEETFMPSIELSDDHATILKNCLERVVSDMSMEIAATDRQDYRDGLKHERNALRRVLEQLIASQAGDKPS